MLGERHDYSSIGRIDSTWGHSQFDRPAEYIQWANEAIRLLDDVYLQKMVIFNCSNGPSTLGFMKYIVERFPSVSTLLTDAQEGIPQVCTEFIQQHLPGVGGIETMRILTEDLHTTPHASEADLFLSFEPIGDLPYAFTRLYETLSPGSRIAVVERGVLSCGVQGLRKTAKALDIKDQLSVIATGIRTIHGEVIVGSLQKE